MKTRLSERLIIGLAFLLTSYGASAAPDVTFNVLHSFSGPDGYIPTWVIQSHDGSVWGVTDLPGAGVLYKIDPAGHFAVVHAFTDQPDGSLPRKLIEAQDGSIYGVTSLGGASGKGSIYRVDPAGNYAVVYSFTGFFSDGTRPNFLMQANDGFFYGTTDLGTFFRLDAAGNFTLLHVFQQLVDGNTPNSVVQASGGLLYGTCRGGGALGGGATGLGTFWRSDSMGQVTLLHVFGPHTVGGDQPTEPVGIVQAGDGLFYGAANKGGSSADDALFRIDGAGTVTTIHSFDQNASDGARPETSFIVGGDGFFYGTSPGGGQPVSDTLRSGLIYRADTLGTVEVLHTFTGGDGGVPFAPPYFGAQGTLFATTRYQGPSTHGVLGWIQLTPPFQLHSAASRKTHGSAGTFDIPLPLSGEPGVECRSSGGSHTLVFTFTNDLRCGGAIMTNGAGNVAGSPSFAGNTMTVNLSGVVDVQKLTVTLSGVTDSFGQSLTDVSVSVNMLIGDVNGSKSVTASDIGQAKALSGAAVDATNFRADVVVSGSITASDIGLVKSRSGQSVP